jgi:hypothetical protein
VPDIKSDILKQIDVNEKLLQEFDGSNLKTDVSGSIDSGTNGVSLEDKIIKLAKESVEQVAMVQLFHGNVTTPLDSEVAKQKKGWLSVYDQNLSAVLGKLAPSSTIGIFLDSPTGKNFVFSFMAELSVPIYIISTSMGKVQIEEMIANRVITPSIYLYLKGKVEKSLNIDEADELKLPIGKCVVFLFMESGQLNGRDMDLGMVDLLRKKFTPPNGYLFIVVEKRFFMGDKGEALLSYISETSLNNIRFFEEKSGRFLEISGFYSMKTYQLKLVDDFSARTKVVGRETIV